MNSSSPAPRRAGLSRTVMVGLHMQITPALVRTLGNANAACVLVMIQFRTQVHGYRRMDGTVWWKASLEDLAGHTGLSRDQVNRILVKLVTDGYVAKAQHYKALGDQTASYRILFDDGETELLKTSDSSQMAKSPDALWTTHVAESPDAGQTHVAESPDAPAHVAESPDHRGDSATGTVAIPPSLPIRRFEEEDKKGGSVTSPAPVDKFAPLGPLPRPERCADHQDEAVPPPCGACKDARLTLELVEADVERTPLRKCEHSHVAATCPYCPGGKLAHLESGVS